MKLVANELKDVLLPLSKIVDAKQTIENGDKFLFKEGRVYAYNGEIFSCDKFDIEFDFAVSAESFFKLINKYGMNEIEIKLDTEASNLLIIDDKSESTFPVELEFEVPIGVGKITWSDLPEDFSQGLTICSYTTGDDFSEIRNVCVHLDHDLAESTDGKRLTQYFFDTDIKKELFLPKTIIKYIAQVNPIQFSKKEEWIYMRNSAGLLVAFREVIVDDFYDLQSIVDNSIKGEHIPLPDKVIDSLEKAEIFLSDQFEFDRFVTLTCKNKTFKITSKGNQGKFNASIKIKCEHDFEFNINPRSLIEILINGNTLILGERTLCLDTDKAVLVSTLVI